MSLRNPRSLIWDMAVSVRVSERRRRRENWRETIAIYIMERLTAV